LGGSASLIQDRSDQVRRFTRALEFDYVSWTMQAVGVKLGHSSLTAPGYLSEVDRELLVRDYLEQVRESGRLNAELQRALADPSVADPELEAGPLMQQVDQQRQLLSALQPLAESVLQENVATVLSDWGLGIGGSAWPPVSFRFSQLPVALIVSPRDVIQQDANIQLEDTLSLEDQIELERSVESGLDVSALVVPIGGLSTYPTMVAESAALDWLTETVAHEWVHHYLALRPLGLGYSRTPEMRAINETVAGLIGREIGREVLRRYYPDDLPPPPVPSAESAPPPPSDPPAFDFRAAMRETRLRADELLAEGRIEQAEAYMEARRELFWDNGYRHIRRINQAYFAFYGAYADTPRGEAGADPVGEAVRTLWERFGDPVAFLREVAWVASFAELLDLLESDSIGAR
jgi:hypothetical protein